MTCSGTDSGRHSWNYSGPHVQCRKCHKTRADVAKDLSIMELLDIGIEFNENVIKTGIRPFQGLKSVEYYEGALDALLHIKRKIK